jgi:hypothetical protein
MERRVGRGKRSSVLGPLPPNVSKREARERDRVAKMVRSMLEDDDVASELGRRATEGYP